MDLYKWLRWEYRSYLRRKSWQRVVRTLAMIVVFCTTYALILPAITMEAGTVCGHTEHTHTDSCYETRNTAECTLPESSGHTHTDACYTRTVICGQEERSAHSHTSACFGPIRKLVCKECGEGHTHVATCYFYGRGLVCGLEETEGHAHGEDCFQSTLTCLLEESAGHSHTSDPTVPGEVLVCGLAEHCHEESCYPATEPETEETQETTVPQGDPAADLETREDWEATLSAVTLTGDWSEDLIAVARSQLGYRESGANYITDESGVIRGYSRYGQWQDRPYDNWSAMFVSFCLHYADVENVSAEGECQTWLESLQNTEHYRAAAAYTPVSGDLIFLDGDLDGVCGHVGIVEAVSDGTATLIVGDWDDRVERTQVSLEDPAVLGFFVLPGEPEEAYIHSAEDGTQTEVLLPGNTSVPEDAALTVTPVMAEDETYSALAEQILQKLDGTAAELTLLDISFYAASGEYLSVPDTALVSIRFDQAMFAAGKVKVFHFVDGVPVELENVSVSHVAAAGDREETVQTQLTFETEGFSVFAVVSVHETYDRITVTDPADLVGNSYYIVSNNQNYIMLDSIYAATGWGLDRASYTGTDSLDGQTTWTFMDAGDGTFYIRSNQGNYMVMADSSDSSAKVSLTASQNDATKFTVKAINGQAEISYDGPNGIAHYLNVYQGDKDFRGWQDSGTQDAGSKVYLHIAKDNSGSHNLVTGLGGRTFALVSNAQSKAITTESTTVNSVPGLKSQAVTITTVDNIRYVMSDAVKWTFDETDTEGVYHIYTEIDGSKRYLTLLATHYQANNPDGRGSLSVSDTPQDITVIANDDGTVYLSATVDGCTGYINLDQSGSGSFWTYKSEDASNKLLLCEEITEMGLFYDLNAPAGATWYNTPAISDVYQEVTEDGAALYSVEGGNAVGSFVVNTLAAGARPGVISYYNTYNTGLGDSLNPDSYLAPGAEYRFLGWKATVDGNDYLFPESAPATLDSQGYIHIVDAEGTERILPPNTTLTGQWEKRSDVVLFFVNFGDTMLETQDNQPIIGYGSNYYTGVVAIGHIYDPTTISPGKNQDNKDTIMRSNDAAIQAQIVAEYDPGITTTQIVIDAVSRYNENTKTFEYETVTNFNQTRLEEEVGQYLQDDPNKSTQVKIDNAYVDKSEITAENYKLYWYLQKEVSDDGWHIDGVLVARTEPMEIYKTFSGLTDEETNDAIDTMTFPLGLIYEDDTGTAQKQDYTTMTANSAQEGVYTNDGQQGLGHIYKWTLQSIKGQRYSFSETGYEVADHDWSGLISVHYSDGSIEYRYNTDTTFGSSDLFADKPLVGGQIESVIFANFYTAEGTGAFSVSKVADEAGQVRLPGAEFTLKNGRDQVVAAVTTNDNGAAHFADLEEGTYYLSETKSPTGYQELDTTWTVQVVKDDSGNVTVTIRERRGSGETVTLYDSGNGGIQQVYLIQNTPQNRTMTINKYFTTITDTEVKELENYSIQVRRSDGTGETMTLTLDNATPITGTINGYTWIRELDPNAEYTFVEQNYLHENYLDTVVSANCNGTVLSVEKSSDNTSASFAVTKSESADTVNITNGYTNTFLLRIRKVDATNNGAVMEGVKFNIYGDFEFHTTPPEGVNATIRYTSESGESKQAYYIGTTAGTNASGITEYVNMRLSSGSNSFLYVIDEANTPAGYVKLDEPIVRVVEVNGQDPNYSNGVYTLTVENYQEAQATVSVTADKVWSLPEGMSAQPVTLTLYQKTADGTVSQISQVTLDGTAQSQTTAAGITTAIDGWKVSWSGLTYADGSARNEFYVSETLLPGYSTVYSTAVSSLKVGSTQVEAAVAEGYNLKRSVTVTNTPGFELPDTGGSGTRWFTGAGLLLILTSLALAGYGLGKSRGWLHPEK